MASATVIALGLLLLLSIPIGAAAIIRIMRADEQRRRDAARRVAVEVGGGAWDEPRLLSEQPFKRLPEFVHDVSGATLHHGIEVADPDGDIAAFLVRRFGSTSDIDNRMYVAIRVPGAQFPKFHADARQILIRRMVPEMKEHISRLRLSSGAVWRVLVSRDESRSLPPRPLLDRLCEIAERYPTCQLINGGGEWLLAGGAIGATEEQYRELISAAQAFREITSDS